jgi:hypothetical protein
VSKRIHAKNKRVLAVALGIGQQALKRLFDRNDHPKQVAGQGYDIAQWQRYADNNIAFWNRPDSGARGAMINAREQALIRKNEISAERERFKLDIERGKYEEKSVTAERVLRNVTALFKELDKAFRHELPPRLAESSVGEIARILGAKLDEQRQQLYESFNGNGKNGQTGVAG